MNSGVPVRRIKSILMNLAFPSVKMVEIIITAMQARVLKMVEKPTDPEASLV
jgi:hypothetical protein